MDRLQAMQVFMRVVETGSFTKAADALSMASSSVTGIVKQLERYLNVRLLQRTTRRLSLTSDGAQYYAGCQAVFSALHAAEQGLPGSTGAPAGRLRVDMPGSIGRALVIPNLQAFRTLYPDILLAIGMSDRNVDLIQDGVDCVIRAGALPDSGMVARRLGDFDWITCAAPAYLASHGLPGALDDLSSHVAVQYFSTAPRPQTTLRLRLGGVERDVAIATALAVNETEAYVDCAVRGFGLVQLSAYVLQPYLASGQLVEVLADARPAAVPVSVLYPHYRNLAPAVSVFIEWLVELFAAEVVAQPGAPKNHALL